MIKSLVTKNKVGNLPLMELFHTLQGEGFHTGKPAVFIRLAGCDVGCLWCDVKESWNPDNHQITLEKDIIKKVLNFKTKFVVITGGEPSLHNLDNLVEELETLIRKEALQKSEKLESLIAKSS